MTREEALEILDRLPTIGEQVDALDMAIEALEQSQWIPATERLPEEGEVVLICVQFEYAPKMFVASRQDYNYWTGAGARFSEERVAWMPLPEPYKGGEKDG